MELHLTEEQKNSLNEHGRIKAATLQSIYKKSVQDQQKTFEKAEKIRAQRRKSR